MKKIIYIIITVIIVLFASCKVNYGDDINRKYDLIDTNKVYRTEDEYFDITITSMSKSFEYNVSGEETQHADIIHNFLIIKLTVTFNGTGRTVEDYNELGEKNGDELITADSMAFSIYTYANGSINKTNSVELISKKESYNYFMLKPHETATFELRYRVLAEIITEYPSFIYFKYGYFKNSDVYVPFNFNPDVYTDIPLSK